MKRFLACLLVLLFAFSGSCALAEDYDFANMTAVELNALIDTIEAELDRNHTATGLYTSAADSVIKGYVEDYYGKDNVDWAWIDYTYTRDWEFFTMTTHADIVKKDGGKARFDVYGEIFPVQGNYTAVYVQIGTEVILDRREECITDNRILAMLGLAEKETGEPDEDTSVPDEPDETPEAAPEPQTEAIIAKRGDKNGDVTDIQKMLIRLGCLSGSADGDFGGKTEQAVTQFQKEHGLTQDGIVTETVYAAIKSAYDALPVPVEYPTFTVKELFSKYEKNELAADKELKNQYIKVKGRVYSVSDGWFGTINVTLDAGAYTLDMVHCTFDDGDSARLSSLEEGDTITVIGKCGGMSLLSISLSDCTLAN